jgi:beta-lactamase superfamily II metal-dependent hydrolase
VFLATVMDRNPPAADEIEFSVFGRGFGEAICVHLGDGEWAVVDSCMNPQTVEPAALTYLASLGLSPNDDVRIVVATHWHDDHVQGLGEVVEACANATVVCSAALDRKEIVAFVLQQEAAKGAIGSGLDELRSILHTCGKRQRSIVWAKATLPLHPRPPGDVARVVALSPSEDAVERAMQDLIAAATSAKITVPRRYRAPERSNGASVAVSIRNENVGLLLGADLEASVNPEAGWKAVVAYARPTLKASAVKVPHHGSLGAHHDEMWSELLERDVLAVLTPWIRGAKYLPTEADIQRIVSLSKKVYITAMPASTIAKKKADKAIRRVHGANISELRGWGHVRARRRLTENDWRVELDGGAAAVT